MAYVGPERDDERDHFVREARVREDFGKYRRQAHDVRLLVPLPTTGRVDPRDVRIIGVRRNRISMSFDHPRPRCGAPQSVESSASSVFRSQVRALRVGFVWIPVRYRAPVSCARFLARFIGGLEGLG